MNAYPVVHSSPGRLRVHLSGWSGCAPREIQRAVCGINGVSKASASSHTRNLLVHFDPHTIDKTALLDALERKVLGRQPGEPPPGEQHPGSRQALVVARLGLFGGGRGYLYRDSTATPRWHSGQ